MTRIRSTADLEALDEERVALRVRIRITEERGGDQSALEPLRAQVVQLDRRIASLRATERRAYHAAQKAE